MMSVDEPRGWIPQTLKALIRLVRPPSSRAEIIGTLNFWRFKGRVIPQKIARFERVHAGETIFVVGGGPSVHRTNLGLVNRHPVIFCNVAVRLAPEFSKSAKYWIVVSGAAMNQFKNIGRENLTASFRCIGAWPARIEKDAITEEDVVLPVRTKKGLFRVVDDHSQYFSEDLAKGICHGGGSSVIFSAIQLAAYMGASEIVLLGADFGVHEGSSTHFVEWDRPPGNPKLDWGARNRYEDTIRPALRRYLNIAQSQGFLLVNGSAQSKDDVLPRTKKFVLNRS